MSSNQGRVTRACRACQQRKVGCDKLKPVCTRCRDASRACVYDTERRQPRRHIRFIDETSRIAANASPSTSEAGPSAPSASFQPAVASESEEPTVLVSAARLAEVESRLATLTAAIRSTRSSSQGPSPAHGTGNTVGLSSIGTAGVAGQGFVGLDLPRTDFGGETDLVQADLPDLGHLSLQGEGRARFVASSFWANMCDEVSAVDDLLREQTRYTGPSASGYPRTIDEPPDTESEQYEAAGVDSSVDNERSIFGDMLPMLDDWDVGPPRSSRFQKLMPDIVPDLPTRALCDQLLASYIEYYYTVSPFLHAPSVKAEYAIFWESDLQTRRTKCAAFIPLMVAILFAGAHICDRSTIHQLSGRTRGEIVNSLHKLSARTLRYANFPRTPTVELLSAFLIIQNTVIREEQPLACCSYVGTAVRVAQMLGCNIDPSNLDIPLDPIAAEVRRRLSWQVHHLDVMVALAAGLPPLIDPQSWSVDPMSELRDELIGTVQGMAYDDDVRAGRRRPDHAGRDDSMVSASSVFAAAKYHTAFVTRRMLTRFNARKGLTAEDLAQIQQDLEQVYVDLTSRIDRLPKPRPGDLIEPDDIFAKWSRFLLSAFKDRDWSYLSYPLSRAATKLGIGGVCERILYHSHKYLQKMVILTGFEAFGPLQWSWPGIHQPLHAMMVLLYHVNRHPTAPSCEPYRNTIDEVLALCGPDGGMIGAQQGGRLTNRPLRDGGFEVWELIHRFRIQAWIKGGLDPDVIPTRDEVEAKVKVRAMRDEVPEEGYGSIEIPADSAPTTMPDVAPMYGGLDLQLPGDDSFMDDFDLDPTIDWFQWEM